MKRYRRAASATVTAAFAAAVIAPFAAVAQTGEGGSTSAIVPNATAEHYENAARAGGMDYNKDGVVDERDLAAAIADQRAVGKISVDRNGDGVGDALVDPLVAIERGYDTNGDGYIHIGEARRAVEAENGSVLANR